MPHLNFELICLSGRHPEQKRLSGGAKDPLETNSTGWRSLVPLVKAQDFGMRQPAPANFKLSHYPESGGIASATSEGAIFTSQ